MEANIFNKHFVLIVFIIMTVLGCQHSQNNTDNSISLDSAIHDSLINDTITSQLAMNDSGNVISYIFPSPDEILGEILSLNTEFDLKFVNPLTNSNKYIETKYQALNMGVYLADLAYINSNGEQNTAISYLKTIRKLAQKINIHNLMDDNLYTRIQNNLANKDSLNTIFKVLYNDIGEILEASKRNNLYTLIASGALIEVLYISTMTAKTSADYQQIATKIFEQKYLVDHFYNFASQYKHDKNVRDVLLILEDFKKILHIADIETKKTTVENKSKDHFEIKGGDEILVTEIDFNNFKENILKVRQDIINAD